MFLIKENEVYKRESERQFGAEETITFKIPEPREYKKHATDWYMTVALEKSDQVTKDRHLLTGKLLIEYRWAIREGYNHQLDPHLQRAHSFPRNRNTIAGIQGYIDRIIAASDKQMEDIRNYLGEA